MSSGPLSKLIDFPANGYGQNLDLDLTEKEAAEYLGNTYRCETTRCPLCLKKIVVVLFIASKKEKITL